MAPIDMGLHFLIICSDFSCYTLTHTVLDSGCVFIKSMYQGWNKLLNFMYLKLEKKNVLKYICFWKIATNPVILLFSEQVPGAFLHTFYESIDAIKASALWHQVEIYDFTSCIYWPFWKVADAVFVTFIFVEKRGIAFWILTNVRKQKSEHESFSVKFVSLAAVLTDWVMLCWYILYGIKKDAAE